MCQGREAFSESQVVDKKWFIRIGFSGGSDGKGSTCSTGDLGLIPGSGRSPGEANCNSLQYSCLENPMDRVAWWLQSTGSQRHTPEQLTLSLSLIRIGHREAYKWVGEKCHALRTQWTVFSSKEEWGRENFCFSRRRRVSIISSSGAGEFTCPSLDGQARTVITIQEILRSQSNECLSFCKVAFP